MNQNTIIFEDDLNTMNKDVWFGNAEIVKKSLRISDSRSDIEVHLISKPFPVERSAGYLLTFKCLPLGEAVRKAGGFLAFYDAAGNKLGAKETPAAVCRAAVLTRLDQGVPFGKFRHFSSSQQKNYGL